MSREIGRLFSAEKFSEVFTLCVFTLKQGGSGTEPEPETGTVGTVFPETDIGTGTVGAVFQGPKPELEPSLSNSLY